MISHKYRPKDNEIEIIAGRDKVLALHIFDQSMVGRCDQVSYDVMEIIREENVQLISKEMNANSITYYLDGKTASQDKVINRVEKLYPKAKITGEMVALISVIGSRIDSNQTMSKGMLALLDAEINLKRLTRRCAMWMCNTLLLISFITPLSVRYMLVLLRSPHQNQPCVPRNQTLTHCYVDYDAPDMGAFLCAFFT